MSTPEIGTECGSGDAEMVKLDSGPSDSANGSRLDVSGTCDSASCGDRSPKHGAMAFDPASLSAPDDSPLPDSGADFMNVAFAAARDALAHQEVPVGCVFVRASHVLASGRNTVNETKNATRHAELNCVDQVYSRCAAAGLSPDRFWGEVDVFVTVEPCVMCAAALIQLGVRSVTYGAANQRFGGCGSVLDVPGEMMPSAVRFQQDQARVEEAVALLKEFYKGENPNAPRPQG